MACLFGRSVATNVSITAVDVLVLLCSVKEQSKYRSLQMPDLSPQCLEWSCKQMKLLSLVCKNAAVKRAGLV